MSFASAVIEIKEGMSETVLGKLARMLQISVYGMKGNQIVTVIEGDTMQDVDEVISCIFKIEEVTGVYPVFAGDDD